MRRAALILLVAACGAPPGERSLAIVGGVEDLEHPAVVALRRASDEGLCSGVVVAPGLVLTAAHCVADTTPEDVTVAVGVDAEAPDYVITAAGFVVYPTVTPDLQAAIDGGIDLAFVRLTQEAGVEAMPLLRGAALARGDLADAVGYGDDLIAGSGRRRRASVTIDWVCPRLWKVGDEEQNACTGDSGGALLSGGALAGVISFGRAGCTAPAGVTRVDVHLAWLDAVIAAGGAVSCPDCLQPDPACPLTAPTDAGDDGGADDGGCAVGGRRAPAGPGLLLALWVLGLALRRG